VASLATGINDSGDILGFYLDEQFQPHAFILPAGGTMQPIDGVSEPSGLAANGWFTGMSANSQAFRAVLGGVTQDLTAILGLGTAVNGRGAIRPAELARRSQATPPTAFRYSDAAGFVDLGTFGGA
jgi:hypothetical protein